MHKNAKDLSGKIFGRLTVIELSTHKDNSRRLRWKCQCSCGQFTEVSSGNLGKTTFSCGCLNLERITNLNKTHGEGSFKKGLSKEYIAWRAMIARCTNPKHQKYKYYGGRGIKVCNKWLNNFQLFLDDIGRAPTLTHTVDRINSNKNYCPGNVRWATMKEQANNRRKRKTK